MKELDLFFFLKLEYNKTSRQEFGIFHTKKNSQQQSFKLFIHSEIKEPNRGMKRTAESTMQCSVSIKTKHLEPNNTLRQTAVRLLCK